MTMAIKTKSSNLGSSPNSQRFAAALMLNFIWINVSEVWRYLTVIRPTLQETFPDDPAIAPFDLTTFAIWSVWDTILIIAATGFFWIYFNWSGASFRNAVISATLFTITVFGLLWLGAYNMGLVPARFIWIALPLAWFEQVVAAAIVWRVFPRN